MRHVRNATALSIALLASSGFARADGTTTTISPQACFADAVAGQELRNSSKLRDARTKLLSCAQPSCPREVVRDCTKWLEELTLALPTFVFEAHGDNDVDLADAKVFVDDVLAGNSDGTPAFVDPGLHRIRFEHAGYAPVIEQVVAHNGEKNRRLAARFGTRGGVAETNNQRSILADPTTVPPERDTLRPHPRPIPTLTWVFGGVGVASLGVFGYFGATGVSDYNHFHCDAGCEAGDKKSVDSKFLVADIALGISIAALAGATIVYLVSR